MNHDQLPFGASVAGPWGGGMEGPWGTESPNRLKKDAAAEALALTSFSIF